MPSFGFYLLPGTREEELFFEIVKASGLPPIKNVSKEFKAEPATWRAIRKKGLFFLSPPDLQKYVRMATVRDKSFREIGFRPYHKHSPMTTITTCKFKTVDGEVVLCRCMISTACGYLASGETKFGAKLNRLHNQLFESLVSGLKLEGERFRMMSPLALDYQKKGGKLWVECE